MFVRGHDPVPRSEQFSESRKTVSFEGQTMSKDKYQSIYLRQMGAIVFYYPSILFLATRAVLKIPPGSIWSREAFRPIARERKYLMEYKFQQYVYLSRLFAFDSYN